MGTATTMALIASSSATAAASRNMREEEKVPEVFEKDCFEKDGYLWCGRIKEGTPDSVMLDGKEYYLQKNFCFLVDGDVYCSRRDLDMGSICLGVLIGSILMVFALWLIGRSC
jgi:hypothetical protein